MKDSRKLCKIFLYYSMKYENLACKFKEKLINMNFIALKAHSIEKSISKIIIVSKDHDHAISYEKDYCNEKINLKHAAISKYCL